MEELLQGDTEGKELGPLHPTKLLANPIVPFAFVTGRQKELFCNTVLVSVDILCSRYGFPQRNARVKVRFIVPSRLNIDRIV